MTVNEREGTLANEALKRVVDYMIFVCDKNVFGIPQSVIRDIHTTRNFIQKKVLEDD